MLQIAEISRFANTSPRSTDVTLDRPVRTMSGRRLNHLLKGASPADRALLAYDLARGVVQIVRPTHAQAAGLTHVSTGYVDTVSRLTGDERVRIARGELALSRLHKRRRNLSDAELDRVVEHYGAEALWHALDRATAPSCNQT